jgi:hypothetical protein
MRSLALKAQAAALATALLGVSAVALAGPSDAILLPTALPDKSELALHPENTEQLTKLAHQLDAILSEAVQDLGLTLTVSDRSHVVPTDDMLVERAAESWIVSPRVSLEGSGIRLRIVAVAPGQNVLRERTLRFDQQELEVRANVMMRDVVRSAGSQMDSEASHTKAPEPTLDSDAPRSQGRAVLALNAAVVGGYVGFSLQHASGSNDARLTYPLVALGTGIGLGASMLIADEWDITLGDAWFLSAGAWWPIASGVLLAKSYNVQDEDRYVYGLVAASAGVSLSAAALSLKPMSEGGAVLAHSGGAAGTLIGGLAEMAYYGSTKLTPERGIGYGAGIGVLAAGALATQVKVTSSRMLLIDLSASLGALTGAAAASPLLLVREKESLGRNRLWLASIAAGTVVGGGIGWLSTRGSSKGEALDSNHLHATPYLGMEPADPTRGTRSFMSLGVQGLW